MNDTPGAAQPVLSQAAKAVAIFSLMLFPVGPTLVIYDLPGPGLLIGGGQLLLSVGAGIAMFVVAWRRQDGRAPYIVGGLLLSLIGLAGPAITLFFTLAGALGGAWGRPLRVKGRQLHPELKEGADWTAGERPDPSGLDEATRAALEALWLHDAQKEHASVPAFSRVSWLLAAVGAPAELMLGAHRAAMEEVDHAQRCFALAAGYGGRSHTVEPMPDLLLGGLDAKADPLVTLAVESLEDGCLLEDFNADVAGICHQVCEEPATKEVLRRITIEERSHAELSWEILTWSLEAGGERVAQAVRRAMARLEHIQRPTSATEENARKVALADPTKLRAHGRIEDAEWAACWTSRVHATRARASQLLHGAATPQPRVPGERSHAAL